MKALKECTCNVQPLQELAHEATLNFSLDDTISAMMMHIGDGPPLQNRSKSWRLSTDTMQVSGWWRNTRNFFKKRTRISKHVWPQSSKSYIHGALPLPPRTFVLISCWVQEPLTQNVQITQKAHVLKELLHWWKTLGDSTEDRAVADCNISNNTFTILTHKCGSSRKAC